MLNRNLFAVLALVLLASGARCFAGDDHKPAHGGTILEVGEEAAHIELVHDEKAGKITLYIMGPDAKTALPIKDAPKVNLKTAAGNKQLETTAVDAKDGAASTYTATDDALKTDPLKGRIVLTVAGKPYNVDIKDEHKH